MKAIPQEVKTHVKETHKQIENHRKDIKSLQTKLDKAYKNLDKCKLKYVKSHKDWEFSKELFKHTEAQGVSTKSEIEKMNLISVSRGQQVENYKGDYAHQLVKTNQSQAEYFQSELPAVLDSLQSLSHNNCLFFKRIFNKCVASEKEAAFIISKCHEEIESVLHDISPEEDTEKVIEKYKTGNIPPLDLHFDDLSDDHCKAELVDENDEKDFGKEKDGNLYQKKREIEKRIKDQQSQIEKGLSKQHNEINHKY